MAPANKNSKNAKPAAVAGGGSKTRIGAPVLDRLIKEKMARSRACDGVAAMPVVRSDDPSRGCNWRVPGYTGDGTRVSRCEAALRDYLEFLATQFELDDD
jgi:hypothetical protein